MNTIEIIDYVAKSFHSDISLTELDFKEWALVYRYWEQNWLDEEVKDHIPLREPVIKLVYKTLYGKMPFDKEYVLKNYEKVTDGIEYLYYPSEKPKNIMVFFSGYSERKTYNRYSWYWDEKEAWDTDTIYLFVRDPENYWYSECRFLPKLRSALERCVTEVGLSFDDCIFIGGSMGGYGALRYGIELNVGGVVAIHPQLELDATKLHHDVTWFNNISHVSDSFVDISTIVNGSLPKVYLEFGDYEADKIAANRLIKSYDASNGILIVSKHNSSDHVTASPSRSALEAICTFFKA